MVSKDKETGWREVVTNVERLILDANLLHANRRYPSAMSTAILAFEEAGKGSNYETNFGISRKGKAKSYSWHMLRQIVTGFFLNASLMQKYGLLPELSETVKNAILEHWNKFDTPKDAAAAPIPEEMRKAVIADMQANKNFKHQTNKFSKEDMFIYTAEQRWCRKLIVSAMTGKTEALRQKGMYVDLDGDIISSTPLSADGVTSQYWINAAERALLILRDGNYYAPYGYLSAYLESLERPFDPIRAVLSFDEQLRYVARLGNT